MGRGAQRRRPEFGGTSAATLASVMEPGHLLAAGRDADIFEYGRGLVLRGSREGRSMALEAQVMEHVRSQGFPTPVVEEPSDDGLDLIMERIEGADMVATMSGRPWTIAHQGQVLADLHIRLHQLTASGLDARWTSWTGKPAPPL